MSRNDKLLSLELRISKFLRYGVLAAGALLLFGWMTMLNFHDNPLAAFGEYKEESFARSLQEAWQAQQWGLLIAYAGLVVLISLPLIRVLLTALLFLKQKEKILAAIAFVVLVTLLISFSLGIEL